MGYSVQQRAECVGTFRWVEIQLMETLARWIPTTPEMEVKILFGRHVWDCAQHADALGKRAFELRAPLHYTLPATDAYRELLRDAGMLQATADRVSAFYDGICPGLAKRYGEYLAATDALMDEPTVRVIEGILRDYERMGKERTRLAGSPATSAPADWLKRDAALAGIVEHGEEGRRTRMERA
jgi:hypothetical protein